MQPAKESSSLSLHDALAMSSRHSKFKLKSLCSNLSVRSYLSVSLLANFGQWPTGTRHLATTPAHRIQMAHGALFSGLLAIFGSQAGLMNGPAIDLGTDFGWLLDTALLLAAIASLDLRVDHFFFFFMLFKPRFECTRMAGESKVWQSMTTSSPRLTASAGLSSWPSGQTAVIQLILKRYLKKHIHIYIIFIHKLMTPMNEQTDSVISHNDDKFNELITFSRSNHSQTLNHNKNFSSYMQQK